MEKKPNVWCITATCGRHTTLERLVACFVAQDYEGEHTLLIFNNSEVEQELGECGILPPNKHIEVINQFKDSITKEGYTTLGAIYRDALDEVPNFAEVITHMDDDDLFLPNHVSEGVKGYEKAILWPSKHIYRAYKPEQSWFRHASGVEKMGNNLEPSIFINAGYLKHHGYKLTTTDQHFGWFGPLLEHNELLIDKEGVSTLIYNWGDYDIPTFKTSGNAGNPDNFNNYRAFSQDHGNQVITPLAKEKLQVYFDQVKTEEGYVELRK